MMSTLNSIALTDKFIDKLKQKPKEYTAWDNKIKGFGCRVSPKGIKTFYYKYRVQGTLAKMNIGRYGVVTTTDARKKCEALSSQVFRGIDPRDAGKQQKQEQKNNLLFVDFWDIFHEKYIQENHKKTTIKKDRSRVKNYILPFFGKKQVATINQQDIIAFADQLAHYKGTLSKALQLLSKAFNQAELWGYRQKNTNPTDGIKKQSSKKMERFLTAAEKEHLEAILNDAALHDKRSPYAIAAIKMLLYTGCRESEITKLKWEEVHLNERYLYLKDEDKKNRSIKTGTRTVPLNDQAIAILKNLDKRTNNPHVFCGSVPGQAIYGVGNLWTKVRQEAGIPDVRLHDLRHSFASFALKKGVDLYTVSKLLGHKNITTTTRYAHLELDALKEATNKIF